MPTFWMDIIRYGLKNDYVNPHLPLAESGISSLFIPKRKIVTTYQCDLNLGGGALDQLIAFISTNLMRLQLIRSRVIVPSSRDYFENSKMKRYMYKAVPIGPPVTASEFFPVDAKALFKRLKVKDSDIKIGFVGRVVYEKGINYLLEAIPYLRESIPTFKVIIVGDYEKVAGGSIKQELDSYMEKYPDNILFAGYLDDADRNRFYSGLDVFVLPSIDPLEAYGMVQIEAMLCGAPVVASDLPGVREIVRKSGFGQISKRRNPRDIAEQIAKVVKNPQKDKPHREEVIRHFDPQAAIDAYAGTMPENPTV